MAAGLKLNLDSVKGLRQALDRDASVVTTNYTAQHCTKTARLLKSFDGGTAIFTFPSTPVKCAGARSSS